MILLWDRFVHSPLSAARDGCAVVAAALLLMGWFSYLKLDGVRIHRLPEESGRQKPKRQERGDIVDFVDEHVVSFDELEPDEQTTCILAAALVAIFEIIFQIFPQKNKICCLIPTTSFIMEL